MKYCKKCIQTDTRPNTFFSDSGVCPACEYFAEHGKVNWESRASTMQKLADKYRNTSSQYDCIIGVSGGKDSIRQAIWIRDYLKLRPLLVSFTYPPEQVTELGASNISNIIELGFDLLQVTTGPLTYKDLLKIGFQKFGNWAKASEMLLYSSVPRVAIDYKIPLILWGENPGLQLGDMATLGVNGYDGNNLRNMNTLNSGNINWMYDAGYSTKDLLPYIYPSAEEFEKNNIQIVYLGWFWKDWSLINNGAYSALLGLELRRDDVENTGDLYGLTALDEDWVTVNQMIKYYKYGFGRASDYVNEMIRMGEITRDQGIELSIQYDGCCSPKYIESFSNYIGISTIEFWEKVHEVTDKNLFDINSNNKIIPKFTVGEGLI